MSWLEDADKRVQQQKEWERLQKELAYQSLIYNRDAIKAILHDVGQKLAVREAVDDEVKKIY